MESFQILPTAPLSDVDAARFEALQRKLETLWQSIGRSNPGGAVQEPNWLVVLPSLTADIELPSSFHQVYEERFLFLILLLRQPNLHLIMLTGQPVDQATIDYYLHLLPDVTISHARKRLHMVSPEDDSPRSLVIKMLERPALLARIKAMIPDLDRAHLVPFLTTNLERELAMRLDIPMYAADPRYFAFGSKSGARHLFAEEGVAHAIGVEDLYSEDELIDAIASLRQTKPEIRRLIVKLNEGVSGIGNTVVTLTGGPLPGDPSERAFISERLRAMAFEVDMFDYPAYLAAVQNDGAVVEEMIEGEHKLSPSVQMRISPLGHVELLSTHDQMLGGPSGQSYLGAIFPADPAYSRLISVDALQIGRRLAGEGIVGRFAVDFLVVERPDGSWDSYAIEINLRKGGTTHPFLTLQYLTDGQYDTETGIFTTEQGKPKYYIASDHIESPSYRMLTQDDLFDALSTHRLQFDHTCQTGVVMHMFSRIAGTGRLGATVIGDSPEDARQRYDQFVALLDDVTETA